MTHSRHSISICSTTPWVNSEDKNLVWYISVQFNSFTQWCQILCDTVDTRFPCPSPTPTACSNSWPLSQWCHPTISPTVFIFSSCLQSFPSSGSISMRQLFAWGGQSYGVSASASVLPGNIQDWFPLGLIGLISLQSKGLSNTTVQKHQFFGAQLSL